MIIPEISVLLPVYNGSRFLKSAIESILNQSYRNFEFLIINDGSDDNSEEIILSFNDERIRYIKNESNLGLIATLNKGVELAKGKYIARMDHDDISLPMRFETQLKYFEKEKADLVCTGISFVNAKNEVVAEWNMNEVSGPQIAKWLPKENCIAHPSVMIRSEILKKHKYDPRQKGSEDWDLWLRLANAKCKFSKTKEVLLHYRYHTGSISQKENRQIRTEEKVLILRKKFISRSFSEGKLGGTLWRSVYANIRTRLRILKVYHLASLFRFLKRLFTINPFKALRQYNDLKQKLSGAQTKLYLIWPYSHVGGAERVHADITNVLKEKKPFVIFAGIHKETLYIKNFKNSESTVVNVGLAINYFLTQKRSRKLIEDHIAGNRTGKILGCNAEYFYDLAKKFSLTHEVSELIHDYTFDNTEAWTIENIYVLLNMKYRVFVSNRAKLQAEKLYDFFGFPEEKKQHLKWIVNCTSVPAEKPVKPLSEKLRIVFVGRNSPEKRPHLVYRIISECVKQTKKIGFSFVGDFEERNMKGTKFYGIVYDIKSMEQIWKENDILLLTSEREGFPMVVMEAMAHGVVPVCTPVGDIPLHLNSDRGILLSNDSEDAVVNNAVKILLNLTENRRPIEQMSLNCYNYAKSHYSLERFRKEYLGLF